MITEDNEIRSTNSEEDAKVWLLCCSDFPTAGDIQKLLQFVSYKALPYVPHSVRFQAKFYSKSLW